MELAASRFALASVEHALLDDPARPKIVWVIDEARDWHGVQWPGAAWGTKNPDNFSRDVVIDGASRYEISGQRTGSGPSQATFLLYSAFPGTDAQSIEGAPVIGTLIDRDIKFAADGSFTITIGPEPAAPGSNHLQSGPKAKFIHIRNALGDWTTQAPDRLRVRRISGPPAPAPRTDAAIAEEAAALLKLQVPFWLKFNEEKLARTKPNTVVPLGGRAGGWGFLSSGRFELKDDEALAVTVDPLGAAYLGFQVADVWSIPPNYVERNASLNKSQAKPNADGTYTYVIAPTDPGVWNWVDAAGMHTGSFAIRWQGLPSAQADSNAGVRSVRVVKLADLKRMLPADTAWVDGEGRKRQLADRAASFARRLAH